MKYLFEKLLLEEDGFEDTAEVDETAEEAPVDGEEEVDTTEDEMADTDDSTAQDETEEEPVDDTEEVVDEPTTTTYKVTYKLGSHENWSRINAATEDEATQTVEDYITKKFPKRSYELVSVEEFDEMSESLNESLDGALTDVQPIEDGAAVGMSTVISDLIKSEYEAIDQYNAAIATAEVEGFGDMINVLTEIQAEEHLHIGQLQAILNTLDPNAHLVDDGKQEGIEQLSNPLGDNDIVEESLKEDLDDMSLADQQMFIRCVNEIWNMSVMEWTQKYYDGLLDITTVDSYDDIPDTSNLIEIGKSDLSQGTGNVIVYTYMNAGDGALYRYASY